MFAHQRSNPKLNSKVVKNQKIWNLFPFDTRNCDLAFDLITKDHTQKNFNEKEIISPKDLGFCGTQSAIN